MPALLVAPDGPLDRPALDQVFAVISTSRNTVFQFRTVRVVASVVSK